MCSSSTTASASRSPTAPPCAWRTPASASRALAPASTPTGRGPVAALSRRRRHAEPAVTNSCIIARLSGIYGRYCGLRMIIMDNHSLDFLKRLLSTPGPSGDEAAPARVWRDEAATFADNVRTDVRGSTFAVLEGGAPRVLLAGHVDEIGLMVSYIDDDGYLSFQGVGGW